MVADVAHRGGFEAGHGRRQEARGALRVHGAQVLPVPVEPGRVEGFVLHQRRFVGVSDRVDVARVQPGVIEAPPDGADRKFPRRERDRLLTVLAP